jgi:hypothetical protein
MKKMRNARRGLVGNSEWNRPLGSLGVGGMIILKWILKEQSFRV